MVGKIENKYYPLKSHLRGRKVTNLEKCLQIVLWYLAKGETFVSISDRFDIILSTVHFIVTKYVDCLNKLVVKLIKWPSIDVRSAIADEFKKMGDIQVLYNIYLF